MGSMYTAVLFLGYQNVTSVQPVVAVERAVFYREKAAGMYSAFPYAFAQVTKVTYYMPSLFKGITLYLNRLQLSSHMSLHKLRSMAS
jgi:hypothetical protein